MEKEIKNAINAIVKAHYGIELDDDMNMLSREYPFEVSDLLFIIYCLEKHFNRSIIAIFKTNDSAIFTPNNLANAIAQL